MPIKPQVQAAQYISQFDPVAEQMQQQILLSSQKKYDAAFAGSMEERSRIGGTFFLDQAAKKQTMSRIDQHTEEILKKYEGDYGAASKDIAKMIVDERANPIYGANIYQQQKMKEQQALLNKLGPDAIIRKRINPLTGKKESASVATSLIDPNTGQVRDVSEFDYDIQQRSDYDKELVTRNQAIAQSLEQTGLMSSNISGFLKQQTQQGWDLLSDDEKETIYKTSGKMLDVETTLPDDEQYAMTGEEYARQALPRLFGSKYTETHRTDWRAQYAQKQADKEQTTEGSYIYKGSLVPDETAFSAKNFRKDSPNVKNLFERIIKQDVKPFTMEESISQFQQGNLTLDELQARQIEQNLRNSNPQLKALWEKASTTNVDIGTELGITLEEVRNLGFDSVDDYLDKIPTPSNELIALRNQKADATKAYSKLLMEEADKYISENRLDKDFEINMYQPNLLDKGMNTMNNNWNQNLKHGFTSSDQFNILTGDYAGATAKELTKAFIKNKTEMEIMGVGANDVTGLVWEIRTPDGQTAMVKWNTGFAKQASYIRNIVKQPELIEGLKSSALVIDKDGTINTAMPDVPHSIDYAIREYGLTANVNPNNPGTYFLKDNEGDYVYIENGRAKETKNPKQATALPKALMFDIIHNIGTQE